ncbi:hypothetical protein EAI_10327 [Harpegnathos saltator]|uniref:Uncharacterized protein n=1 Tax=Harpegnathos saltator TaxID=610380 RepID=E2C1Q6_HARSA|nr:hypothetical protein EAI_10327 [Harpegnathos saltator]
MLWIAFYKEYDGLMTEWQSAGRRLALEMSELKECTSLSGTLTPLGRLLTDPTLRRTSRDAEEAIAALEERAAPLLHVEHVRLSVKRARRLVEEVGKAATRLESSFESRRATIRNLAVLRSIEDQAHEKLSSSSGFFPTRNLSQGPDQVNLIWTSGPNKVILSGPVRFDVKHIFIVRGNLHDIVE